MALSHPPQWEQQEHQGHLQRAGGRQGTASDNGCIHNHPFRATLSLPPNPPHAATSLLQGPRHTDDQTQHLQTLMIMIILATSTSTAPANAPAQASCLPACLLDQASLTIIPCRHVPPPSSSFKNQQTSNLACLFQQEEHKPDFAENTTRTRATTTRHSAPPPPPPALDSIAPTNLSLPPQPQHPSSNSKQDPSITLDFLFLNWTCPS